MQNYRQWSALYASYFTIMGLWTAFGPATLLATSPAAAPTALAAITLAYFVATPFAHWLFRRIGFGPAVAVMGSCELGSLALAALAPSSLVFCAPLAFFFGSGTYTLCETQMIEDLARQRLGHEFGRARKWGSAGFLSAALLGGAAFSAGGVGRNFAIALALCAAAFCFCCFALKRASHAALQDFSDTAVPPDGANPAAQDQPLATLPVTADAAQSRRSAIVGCGAVAAMRLAEAVSTTWFGAFWLHTGHGAFETGLLCAVPVAAEFLAMWKGTGWVARFSPPALMLMCCVASALRWLVTPYCNALWCAVPLQSLHAFTFGFFYPASLLWLQQLAGAQFFQVRYRTESVARALTALTSFLAAGWVISHWGYGALYIGCVCLALVSAAWWLRSVHQTRLNRHF